MKQEKKKDDLIDNFMKIKYANNEDLLKERGLEPRFYEPNELWTDFYSGWIKISKKEYNDSHNCAMSYLFDQAIESLTKETVLHAFANYLESVGDKTDDMIKSDYGDTLYNMLLNYRKLQWWSKWTPEIGKEIRSQWGQTKNKLESTMIKKLDADD